jgi:hypothetical protein
MCDANLDEASLFDVLDDLAASASKAVKKDHLHLRTLILRRLDGAERARAKAEDLRAVPDTTERCDGLRCAAREILEALDG